MSADRKDLLELALELTRVAEREILPRFRRHVVRYKADGTEVTDADRAAEEAMREVLARECPDHAVLGEEQGGDTDFAAAESLWLLDPIDGTASFTLGLPAFGVLVGFARRGEPEVGAMRFPAMGEAIWAARGAGCWFAVAGEEPVRARVAPVDTIEEAVCSAGGPPGLDLPRLSELLRRARKFRFVGDCLQHALVCRGRLQVAIDPLVYPWDIAALVPCVEEAGGRISSLEGHRSDILHARSLLSTSAGSLHDAIIAAMVPLP